MSEDNYKPKDCPHCGKPLDGVTFIETIKGDYDPDTDEYESDGNASTKAICNRCGKVVGYADANKREGLGLSYRR